VSDSFYSLREIVFQIGQMRDYRSFKNDGSRRASEIESGTLDRAKQQAENEGESVIVALLSAAASAHEAAETAYLAFECLRDTAEAYMNAREKNPAFATDSEIVSSANYLERRFYDLSDSITEHHKEAQSACDYAVNADICEDEDEENDDEENDDEENEEAPQ
jgi:hypothetical protein